ncbi:RDD family protein, partial [Singulisphaera rosea]
MATAIQSQPPLADPLDTTVRLVTPERIVFDYPLAGPFRRYSAYLLDVGIIVALLIVIALVAVLLASFGTTSAPGPMLVAYFVIMWGYRAACEVFLNGQTLGKRMMGLRVVTDRGVPITATQALLRNLVGALDGTVPFLTT